MAILLHTVANWRFIMIIAVYCSHSSSVLELAVKFTSQICHENNQTTLDGAYLSDFGIDISIDNIYPQGVIYCHILFYTIICHLKNDAEECS